MTHRNQHDDLIHSAREALACARRVRAHANKASGSLQGACLQQILPSLGSSDGFSEAFLDDLRGVIARFEEWVSAGTVVDFEAHDAWDERGNETTAFHRVEEMTIEAQHMAVVLADLRHLAGLIEATLDQAEAEAVAAVLRHRHEGGNNG